MKLSSSYDAVIIGAGHNGLVAASYLARAGLRVLVLEKNDYLGGATYSKQVFPGVAARLPVYAYLVSLLPQKILSELGIEIEMRRRAVASYTPLMNNGAHQGLLISNLSEEVTRRSFDLLPGGGEEYRRYKKLQEMLAIFARKVWPTLLSPLPSRRALQASFRTQDEKRIWEYLVEKPLAALIEEQLTHDAVRGLVFTDAKIGVSTYPEDPTLLQNRTFIYHVIGQGTGEWRVPVGGMGGLAEALSRTAAAAGAELRTSAEVFKVEHGLPRSAVHFTAGEREETVETRFVLFNCASNIANRCLPGAYCETQAPGSVFKLNMALKKLPRLKDGRVTPAEAFTGTFHLNEGYQHMKAAYQRAQAGAIIDEIPGELYCHSLTDPSILSPELQARGYHTLTLFGLDVPYACFEANNDGMKAEVTRRYLRAINHFLVDNLEDCLAEDAHGNACLDARSPVDLENSLGMPKGNIFHGNLTWPFAEHEDEAGTWGVETSFENVFICGSSARRGGAVSGIPGRNAAMKVLETLDFPIDTRS